MGRVLVEAMASGKPVIGSNTGGMPDLIDHGQNGFLFEPGNHQELSQYIEILMQDETLRHKMGKKGRIKAQNYSIEKMVQKIDLLYQKLLKEHLGPQYLKSNM